jgi:poly-gamma-glutamate system protein
MFKPQIQKTKVLFLMAFINVMLVLYVSQSKTYAKQSSFNDKVSASKYMRSLIDFMNEKECSMNDHDIYNSCLIGKKESSITSKVDSTILSSKQLTTHSNFASFMVFLLEDLELKEGDKIAVSMTGSFPGANLALISACEVLGIEPFIISSLASSSYGANKENLTWLDIEKYLIERKAINFSSIGVSIGGQQDLGGNLTDQGIEILEGKIFNSKIKFINERNLDENIQAKWNLYHKDGSSYKAFVNIGGGASSLGAGEGKNFMKGGIIFPISKDDYEEIYYDSNDLSYYYKDFKKSLAFRFLSNDVPFVNVKNIKSLVSSKGISDISDNEGSLFYDITRFNIVVISIALLISLVLSICVGLYSHHQIKRRMLENEIDSVI